MFRLIALAGSTQVPLDYHSIAIILLFAFLGGDAKGLIYSHYIQRRTNQVFSTAHMGWMMRCKSSYVESVSGFGSALKQQALQDGSMELNVDTIMR